MDQNSQERATFLKRMIANIQYDLPNLRNEDMLKVKHTKLLQYQQELDQLCSSQINGGIKHG